MPTSPRPLGLRWAGDNHAHRHMHTDRGQAMTRDERYAGYVRLWERAYARVWTARAGVETRRAVGLMLYVASRCYREVGRRV